LSGLFSVCPSFPAIANSWQYNFALSIEIGFSQFRTYDKFGFSVGIVSVQKVKLLWDKTFSHQLNFGSKKSLPNVGKKWMYFFLGGGGGGGGGRRGGG